MSNLERVCEAFELSILILEATYEIYVPEDVLALILQAIKKLEETNIPLLDSYNVDQEICKEIYCCARDNRDTSLSLLQLAVDLLEFYGNDISQCDFADVDAYIKRSVCYLRRAEDCLGCN